MNREFKDAIENSPIIAAIKNDAELHQCLTCDSRVIFILYGDICNIADIVDTVKSAGKIALVHLDLIGGLNAKEIAVDFIKKYTRADGIISTRPAAHQARKRAVPLYCHAAFLSLVPWRMTILRNSSMRCGRISLRSYPP